jgi:peptidoglycan hydrolase-like protein with peptidoglycan-binding domain
MKRIVILVVAICCAAASTALADATMASAQQALKDQGFYYGEITGQKDADTTAAIRRYQIRNGLKITGDLSAETLKSLRIGGSSAPAGRPAPAPSATPRPAVPPPAPRATPDEEYDGSDLRADPDDDIDLEGSAPTTVDPRLRTMPPQQGYGPRVGEYEPRRFAVFDGTPYEIAPPEVQRDVIARAQSILARQGLYRTVVDGVYGPGTQFAVRAYQMRMGLEPTGAFDMETLASLDLLPRPQRRFDRRRVWPPPLIRGIFGERIYTPRVAAPRPATGLLFRGEQTAAQRTRYR